MASAPPRGIQRRRLRIKGVVQGVGFRPFIHGLASEYGLSGYVLNDGQGVLIEIEGDPDQLDDFVRAVHSDPPSLASVRSLEDESIPALGEQRFRIEQSAVGPAVTSVGADAATCDECLAELFDPANRRYRYPFINCTQCGPRFTIVERVPYDRRNTTMAGFEMCEPCRAEYGNPQDRRFHAEPIACPTCGPRLSMSAEEAAEMLAHGAILAVKGLGGYHLACDASNEEAVSRLRERKHREEKPLAVMSADPRSIAELTSEERAQIGSPARPIVICPKLPESELAPSISPGSPWVGVMLPYTGVHHLLCTDFGGALVMTSGNHSDEPIAFEDDDARERLAPIADAFLAHDRRIHRRCEDSVVRSTFPIRRSRGFAPESIPLPAAAGRTIVGAGAELKSTFCLARGNEAFLSPHLGDLDSASAYRAFRADLELYLEMQDVEPEMVAHDLHPDYLSTRWATEQQAELVGVQHHHAHAASCLAENGHLEPALALVFDGTGYGTDGTIWGGELLRCDLADFERLSHLTPVPLPGGEAAIREPWRTASSYLEAAERPVPFEAWGAVRESLKVNAPRSSGMGRLFDAVAALLGVRERVTYEGQAAMELEHLAGKAEAAAYMCRVEDGTISGPELIAAVHDDLRSGRPRDQIAAAFHEGVAAAAAQACELAAEPRTVVLSGGSFQNIRLLESTSRRLAKLGFRVLRHRLVPPNDGGISYGQAAVAARRSE
jgi:hydrogenase maturation protein HypF